MRNNTCGSPQANGFEFENLIFSLLENEGLEPRTGYRPKGEQIDGSFFWNGSTFLIEAKWTKDPLPVAEIYSFKGKLDGKFHTTSAIFMSSSGYSAEPFQTSKGYFEINRPCISRDTYEKKIQPSSCDAVTRRL